MTPNRPAPRPLGLTLVLSIVGIAGAAALLSTYTRRAESMASFPLLSNQFLYLILGSILLGLIGLYGVFEWRRWGIYLFGLAGASYFGLEWYALQGNPKSARILMAMILVGLNVMPLWWRFR